MTANAASWAFRRAAPPRSRPAASRHAIAFACGVVAILFSVAGQAAWTRFRGAPFPVAETVTLSPGAFMHSRPGEFLKGGHPVASPRILVEILQPLEITKYQVSSTDYGLCVEAGACKPADGPVTAGLPVTGVSHIDAESFARWYSRATGDTWRLPTDEEWAFAASERFVGDIEAETSNPNDPAQRWLALYRNESALGRQPDPRARTQGAFGTNTRGLADVAGNVWEWTSTCYVHVSVSAGDSPAETGIENCGVHAVEGRHRTYMSDFVRDGKSGGCAVGTPPDNLGFRLVREPPSALSALLP